MYSLRKRTILEAAKENETLMKITAAIAVRHRPGVLQEITPEDSRTSQFEQVAERRLRERLRPPAPPLIRART